MQADDKQDQEPASGRHGQAMGALGAGYTLLGAIAVGLLIGYSIDTAAETWPTWTAIMTPVFIFVGLYQVVREQWPK